MLINIGQSDKKNITFDLRVLLETRLLIQANSGGGKSYAIRKLLEESHGQVQQIVLDLEGEFSTLREKYDYIIAGKNGDTSVHPKSANLLARRLLELGVSAICDLYELPKHDRIRFVRLFLESLMSAPKELWHPVLIVIDEAHHFIPEKGQAESAAAVIDMITRGRKRGFCGVLATQRLAKLHKDACAELLNKMIGRTSLDIDRKRASDELGLMGKHESLKLRDLQPGEFHAYGPALFEGESAASGVIQFKVGQVKSHHPKVGSRQLEAPPVPTEKIKKILGKLADLPEAAEKEVFTIENLKRENLELNQKIKKLEKANPVCNHEPIINELKEKLEAQQERLRWIVKEIDVVGKRIAEDLKAVMGKISFEKWDPKKLFQIKEELNLKNLFEREYMNNVLPVQSRNSILPKKSNNRIEKGLESKRVFIPFEKSKNNGELTNPQMKILRALVSFESLGQDSIQRNMLAVHSGVSPTSGGFFNNLGRLRSLGYVDYPAPRFVSITDQGRELAGEVGPIEDIEELHRSWLKVVSSPQSRILAVLIEIYPNEISKSELANRIGVSETSGGYFNNLGRLRTLGALEYPSSGMVKASELLFPEGLS